MKFEVTEVDTTCILFVLRFHTRTIYPFLGLINQHAEEVREVCHFFQTSYDSSNVYPKLTLFSLIIIRHFVEMFPGNVKLNISISQNKY